MLRRQAGISLIAVAVGMALLAAVAMTALFSMKKDRNLFAEGWAQATGSSPAQAATKMLPAAEKASSSPLRKCVIDGKTVVSNTDCKKSGTVIEIHDSRGIQSPKAPPPAEPAASGPNAMQDKIIEKATQ